MISRRGISMLEVVMVKIVLLALAFAVRGTVRDASAQTMSRANQAILLADAGGTTSRVRSAGNASLVSETTVVIPRRVGPFSNLGPGNPVDAWHGIHGWIAGAMRSSPGACATSGEQPLHVALGADAWIPEPPTAGWSWSSASGLRP